MDIADAFGRAVKARRAEVGMTQEDLADEAQVARSFVSAMERGEKAPTIRTVSRLAEALRCKPSDLWLTTERLIEEGTAKKRR